MRVVVFDIWGTFAHFRKFWTTSSSLSYPFPPPPTIRGILGAILGYRKEEYIRKTKPFKVGVRILNPVKRLKVSLNLIDTKRLGTGFNNLARNIGKNGLLHTQAVVEILKNPKYRIYVSSEDPKLLKDLEETLKREENIYTISLGWANFLAKYSYKGAFEGKFIETSKRVDSVIPVENVLNLDFERENPQYLARDRIPLKLAEDRRPLNYTSVVYSLDAKPLRGEFKGLIELQKEEREIIHLFG